MLKRLWVFPLYLVLYKFYYYDFKKDQLPYFMLQSYITVNNFIIFCLFIHGRKKQYDTI